MNGPAALFTSARPAAFIVVSSHSFAAVLPLFEPAADALSFRPAPNATAANDAFAPMIHPFFRQRQCLGSDFDQAFRTMHCTRMRDESLR